MERLTELIDTVKHLKSLMEEYDDFKFHVELSDEDDGSITAYVNELRLVENAKTKEEVLQKITESMKEYAFDYYNEFNYWSKAPNLTSQIPYVVRLLTSSSKRIMADMMICQTGNNA